MKKKTTTWQDEIIKIDGVQVKVKKIEWSMPKVKQKKPVVKK